MLPAVLVAVLVALGPALAKKAMSRHQLELKEHYEHLAKIAEFECDMPQPRLLNVHELFSDFQTRGKAYFPEVTVLHRCDRHVGSCNDATYRCGPTNSSEINMPFKVTYLEEMDGHGKGEWQMEYYPLLNHTQCGCLKNVDPDPPKTAFHIHYVDPALMPPKGFLPLEPNIPDTRGNATSYETPVYNTEQNYTSPSIYDMVQAAEDNINSRPDGVVEEKPFEELNPKPDENNESQNPTYRPSSPIPPSYNTEGTDPDATTIPNDLLRIRLERSGALVEEAESPYDTYLRQAS